MNEEKQINKKINQDILKWVIIGLLIFAIMLLIFSIGVFVGEKKAEFSCRWAENYHKNFAGPRQGFRKNWQENPPFPGDFIESHGIVGEIIEIKENEFVIKGKDNIEKLILITEETLIQKGRNEIKKEDLKTGDLVVVIGSPNKEGKIEAKLIRTFDKNDKMPPIPKRP